MSSVLPSTSFRLRLPTPATARAGVEVVLVLLLAVQAARLTWVLLAPVAPAPRPLPDANLATAAQPVTTDFFFRGAGGAAQPASGAPASFTLHSVRTGVLAGSAILAGADGVQAAYRVGELLPDGSLLESVSAAGVVVRRGAARQDITLADMPAGNAPAPASTLPGASPAMQTPAIDPKKLLSQIGLLPRSENGQVAGYEVQSRGDGALMRQAGLQAGDVLQAVDGNALTPERMGELEQALTTRGTVALTVLRDGQPRTITLQTRVP